MGGLESITVHEGGYMSVYINFLHFHSIQHKIILSALKALSSEMDPAEIRLIQ